MLVNRVTSSACDMTYNLWPFTGFCCASRVDRPLPLRLMTLTFICFSSHAAHTPLRRWHTSGQIKKSARSR